MIVITNHPGQEAAQTLAWELRVEYHWFADDRMSEAHVSLKNGAYEWCTYVFRKNKYHPQSIAASESGRSVTADAGRLAAEQWLKDATTKGVASG